MSDIKEKFNVTVKAGVVSVDNTDGINDSIQQQILQVAGALKARGFTSAELKLSFTAKAES